MSDRYIQSIYSKDAPVWKLLCEQRGSYIVQQQDCSSGQSHNLVLPTSEYMEVPAPERWAHLLVCSSIRVEPTYFDGGSQRIRLDMNGQFIIERKVNP